MPSHYRACVNLRLALHKLLRVEGFLQSPVDVQTIANDGTTAYIIKVKPPFGPVLAEQLSRITGHLYFAREPSFVLFQNSIPSILTAAGVVDE